MHSAGMGEVVQSIRRLRTLSYRTKFLLPVNSYRNPSDVVVDEARST